MQVAQTILQQLGGNRFIAMTGAKHFVGGDDTLSFQIAAKNERKIKGCRIVLDPTDTYTMTFLKKAKKDPVFGVSVGMEVATVREGVYAEDLQRIFTSETGLETRL
jgi:hypothetical protein